jgi:hypothetical protein
VGRERIGGFFVGARKPHNTKGGQPQSVMLTTTNLKGLSALTFMKKEIITLIQCPNNECCGCLTGKVNKKTIDFYCNECGFNAGYIDKKQLYETSKRQTLSKSPQTSNKRGSQGN